MNDDVDATDKVELTMNPHWQWIKDTTCLDERSLRRSIGKMIEKGRQVLERLLSFK